MLHTPSVSNLPVQFIFCPRSGLPLAKVEALCSHGWPMLSKMSSISAGLLHPIYGMPLEKLLIKLKSELTAAEAISWLAIDSEQRELQLTISAIMYALDAIWQPPSGAVHLWDRLEPSLPAWPICIAGGGRLLRIAGWYHYATSKRLAFPAYRISSVNNNLDWQNYSTWLDAAWEIKEAWEKGRDNLAHIAEVKARTDALVTIRSEHIYKRIDLNKVWNWIDIQMAQDKQYPEGRRTTFRSIFLKGDMHPEEWTLDDIEDVQFAVLATCDIGNEIMFFIQKRLRDLHGVVQDFYSSFTMLSRVSGDKLAALDQASPEEQKATGILLAKYDKRLENLTTMPAEPKRESFTTFPLFLKAQAEWRILSRRYDVAKQEAAKKAEQASQAVSQAVQESKEQGEQS